MLKLIIADDERIIRETISTIIDWSQYGIELAGLCSNGIEAYDMILDESPDLVITDIRMPGMNGLELIGRICETDLDTQFILLSGYGEFEYAKQAMKYGVRHYLLKPCNEQQIIDAVKESVSDCYAKRQARRILDSQFSQADSIRHNVVSSIINDALYLEKPLEEIIPTYEPYMDFYFTPYRLFYIYYLEQENLEEFLGLLNAFARNSLPQVSIYGIYVRNTFLIFCQDISFDFDQLEAKLDSVSLEGQHTSLELHMETYSDLKGLFAIVLEKIRRFSTFYFVNNDHALCTCNYTAITQETENYCRAISEGDACRHERAYGADLRYHGHPVPQTAVRQYVFKNHPRQSEYLRLRPHGVADAGRGGDGSFRAEGIRLSKAYRSGGKRLQNGDRQQHDAADFYVYQGKSGESQSDAKVHCRTAFVHECGLCIQKIPEGDWNTLF